MGERGWERRWSTNSVLYSVLQTGNMLVCDGRYEYTKNINIYSVPRRFSRSYKALILKTFLTYWKKCLGFDLVYWNHQTNLYKIYLRVFTYEVSFINWTGSKDILDMQNHIDRKWCLDKFNFLYRLVFECLRRDQLYTLQLYEHSCCLYIWPDNMLIAVFYLVALYHDIFFVFSCWSRSLH